FYFMHQATADIDTLSLHDALPIFSKCWVQSARKRPQVEESPVSCLVRSNNLTSVQKGRLSEVATLFRLTLHGFDVFSPSFEGCKDRKSTRLNSSHVKISYAVFCLK